MEIKKYARNISLLICFTAMLLPSCQKSGVGLDTNLPIVQAYLYPGHLLTVRLYKQKSLTDTAKYGAAITGQQLYVSDGSTQVKLTESANGTYTYSDTTFLVAGKTYTLTFEYLSKKISAQTIMPYKPQDFVTQHTSIVYAGSSDLNAIADTLNAFTWANPDSLNHVLIFNNLDNSYFPLGGGEIRIAGSSNIFERNTDRKAVFYVVSNNFPYYGNYQVILLRVNQEYIDLLKSNTLGANSQNLLNIPTNVVNGLGIFTAMQSDTLYFSLIK